MFGLNLYAMAGMAVIVAIFTAYFFWAQATIKEQNAEIMTYEITVQTQEKALDKLTEDVELIKKINGELSDAERAAAQNASDLADTLRKLGDLATKKPQLVENIINKSAKERLRCYEIATGALPVKDEVNKTCPHLLGKE